MEKQKTLIQGSPEWHTWRRQGIGASDANVIMGTGHMTVKELYNEKLNLDPEAEAKRQKEMEFIAKKGHKLESKSRAIWELDNFCEVPAVTAVHNLFPYMRASLDGHCEEENYIWEHKYCGEEDFQKVLKGEVLEQYKPQLRHQCYVTGIKKNILNVTTEKKDHNGKQIKGEFKRASVEFIPTEKEIKEQNIKIFEFWDRVLKEEPFELGKNDILQLKDRDFGKKIDSYYKIKDKYDIKYEKAMATKTMTDIADLAKEFADLKIEIFANLPHNRIEWKGHKVTESETEKEVVDYKQEYQRLLHAVMEVNKASRATIVVVPKIVPETKISISKTMTRAKESKKK